MLACANALAPRLEVETMTRPVPYQARFPKSKKRRIRKKWRKDPRNWADAPPGFVPPASLFVPGQAFVNAYLAAFTEWITAPGVAEAEHARMVEAMRRPSLIPTLEEAGGADDGQP